MRDMARTGLYIYFGHMAQEFADDMEEMDTRVKSAGKPAVGSSDWFNLSEWTAARDKKAVAAIVFAAMVLEAFINDYAAICLGQEFFDQYLDKMDIRAKWAVIPKLASGRALESVGKDGQGALNKLNQLIKARNFLVHYKSVDIVDIIGRAQAKGHIIITDDGRMISPANAPNPFAKLDFDAVGEARNAIRAMDALASELDAIDDEALARVRLGRSKG